MIWVDREVKKIKERKLPLEWVDDMKTPSGKIHVGALRGVVIHDLAYKVLTERGIKSKFTYVFDDHDPMDAIPSYLNRSKWGKYAGMQLYQIPSPSPAYKNYAEYYAKEFIEVFNSINCHPQIIWASWLYNSGKMNQVIKTVLDAAAKIREIYYRVSKAVKHDSWYPFNVHCEKCRKIGTTQIYKWDGHCVYYRCLPDLVTWAKGCGYQGKISPFNGNGKIPWKVEWATKWKVIGVTVEGAGKDHMSAGGSHDIASAVCQEIFDYPVPYPLPYEWFTIGGRKMSSSKGVGSSAKEVAQILPAELLRFLIVRTPINTHLDFNPVGEAIPNLFDDYDRCLTAYFNKLENKIPQGKKGEIIQDFARIIELSQMRPLPKKKYLLPRFRTIANLIKNKTDLLNFFENQKGDKLNKDEKELLEERVRYAKIYLKNYAIEKEKLTFMQLTTNQRLFLISLANKLKNLTRKNREDIQQLVFSVLKENNFSPKDSFKGLYRVLVGRDFGPKAADIILELGIEKVINRLKESTKQTKKITQPVKRTHLFPDLNNEKIFSIDEKIRLKFPSINIGIAIIENINNSQKNPLVSKELDNYIESQSNLTLEEINSYQEIQSYRKILKFMGVDYHSRRPAPEALLRRVAQKKRIYKINTAADIYNIVAMKYKISGGVYNNNKIKYPVKVRFAKENEKILLFGDKTETLYKSTEIAWFDQIGGFINFGYRDAHRTAVTKQTKDILITIEGVFDVNRETVEKTLKETVAIITMYCGGKLELAGIVSAL